MTCITINIAQQMVKEKLSMNTNFRQISSEDNVQHGDYC